MLATVGSAWHCHQEQQNNDIRVVSFELQTGKSLKSAIQRDVQFQDANADQPNESESTK